MYTKLTDAELRLLYTALKSRFEQNTEDFVKITEKYFAKPAATVIAYVDSEYNDETYDSRISFVIVKDEDGNEIAPSKGNELKAREELRDQFFKSFGKLLYESEEAFEEPLVVHLNAEDLAVYRKTSK